MTNLFLLVFLASLVCLIIVTIKPTAFGFALASKASRRSLALPFGLSIVLLLLAVGATGCAPSVTSKNITERKSIAFTTAKEEDPTLSEGKSEVKETGRKGLKEIRYKVTYVDGKAKSRKKLSQRVVSKPKSEVLLVGTLRTEKVPEEIPFPTQNVDDPNLDKGQTAVRQEGVSGTREKVSQVGYKAGKEVSRTLISETVVKEPTPRIVAVGTLSPPPPAPPSSPTVYITNTGNRYHQAHPDGCHSYLSQSKIPISQSDAEAQGYTPCQCASCNW